MARKLTIINIHKGIAFNGNIDSTSKFIGISEHTLIKRLSQTPVFGIGQYIVVEPVDLKDRNFNPFNESKITDENG